MKEAYTVLKPRNNTRRYTCHTPGGTPVTPREVHTHHGAGRHIPTMVQGGVYTTRWG